MASPAATAAPMVDQNTEYINQLIAQGYDPEVARTHAAQYQQRADGFQASYATSSVTAPSFEPVPAVAQPIAPEVVAAPMPAPPAAALGGHVADYTGLPPNGDYTTAADGSTIYTATDGRQWQMNADQSFDSI
jgi:hypothetical protein